MQRSGHALSVHSRRCRKRAPAKNLLNVFPERSIQTPREEGQQQQKQQQQAQPPGQQQPQKVATPSNNGIRPTTAVYTASSGEQMQQTPRTTKPSSVSEHTNSVIMSATETKGESTETGYEPSNETKKTKKKNNKK